MLGRPKLFLSYATPDRKKVLEVYNFLLANNYTDTWIDCKKILPGQNWDFEIKRNLQKADIVILFISHNSIIRRGYVQKEIQIVLKNLEEKLIDDIYIIPIKIDTNAEIPDLLSNLHWLDINSENALERLKESLIKQVDKLDLEAPDSTTINFSDSNEIQISEFVVNESWEGIPGYEVEYRVPQFSSSVYDNIGEITKIIEAGFINTLHEHRSFKLDQLPDFYNWMQDKYTRTSTFDASYGNVYISNKFISFHYTIHWYGAGAAHPNYNFLTFNFFVKPLLQISSLEYLFEPKENLLEDLTSIVRRELHNEVLKRRKLDSSEFDTELDNLDIESIVKGTQSWDDLSHFTFSNEGVTIYFSPYQIFGYALGAFTINISYKDLPGIMKRIFRDNLPV